MTEKILIYTAVFRVDLAIKSVVQFKKYGTFTDSMIKILTSRLHYVHLPDLHHSITEHDGGFDFTLEFPYAVEVLEKSKHDALQEARSDLLNVFHALEEDNMKVTFLGWIEHVSMIAVFLSIMSNLSCKCGSTEFYTYLVPGNSHAIKIIDGEVNLWETPTSGETILLLTCAGCDQILSAEEFK